MFRFTNRNLVSSRAYSTQLSHISHIFLDKQRVFPLANIITIQETVYDRKHKNSFFEDSKLNSGDNLIFIRTSDSWYHWVTEKGHPEEYYSLKKFLDNQYKMQFDEESDIIPKEESNSKPEIPKIPKIPEKSRLKIPKYKKFV